MKLLFIVLDTVRRDYLSAYGNNWVKTPALDRLASSATVFDNHWVGSLPCMPARREFMTGRYNFIYRGWGPIEPFDDVFPKELREKRGVFSHLLTDHDHYFELGGENYHTAFNTWEFFRGQENDAWVSLVDRIALPDDWKGLCNRGFESRQQNAKNRLKQTKVEDQSGPCTAMAAIDWLDANKAADNWFLQVEIFDPHEPFTCGQEYREMYNDTWEGPMWDWPDYDFVAQNPDAIEHIRKCYAGLLAQTDHYIGKIFDKLEELKLWDDVMIVFTTDHGTMLAEHNLWMKLSMPIYNELGRIPLMISAPGNANGGSCASGMSQTIDLMPTFMDYFGAELPPHVHGHSLRPMIEGGASSRKDGILGYFGMATNITDGHYVYMRNPVNDDAGPLYAYTACPSSSMQRWFPRELNDKVEMGRYFGHTYNLPVYKFPAEGRIPCAQPGEPSYKGRHELYDIVADPEQTAPVKNPAIERKFIDRLTQTLRDCQAQSDQFTRIGLEK